MVIVPPLHLASLLCLASLAVAAPAAAETAQLLAEAQTLQQHSWRLHSAIAGSANLGQLRLPTDPNGQLLLRFQQQGTSPLEGELHTTGLCNGQGMAYRLSERRIRVVTVFSSFLRRCSGAADTRLLEVQLRAQLPRIHSYSLSPGTLPELTLQFSDGSRWLLSPAPSPAPR